MTFMNERDDVKEMRGKPNLEASLENAISWLADSERFTFCLNHLNISASHRRAEKLVDELEWKFEALLDKHAEGAKK